MNTLPEEDYERLAAYALGALDLKEMIEVEALLAGSPAAHDELHELREVVGYLPFAVPAVEPPEHVGRQLFARIAASQEARPMPGSRPAPTPRRRSFMAPLALTMLTALVLLLGGLTWSLRNNVLSLARTNRDLSAGLVQIQQSLDEAQATQRELAAQLERSRQELNEVNTRLVTLDEQLNQDEYMLTFVTAPGVATRQLAAVGVDADARGEMYMYPGDRDAVVLFRGLPRLQPGQVYQFWLADGQNQVAAGIFEVDENGLARLLVEAPREVNAFSQVMVTIERSGGSNAPSDQVVLEGSL